MFNPFRRKATGTEKPAKAQRNGFIRFRPRWARYSDTERIRLIQTGQQVWGEVFAADRALCPICRTGHLQPVEGPVDTRRCDHPPCDAVLTLRDLHARMDLTPQIYVPAQAAAHYRKQANFVMVVTAMLFAIGLIYAAYTGSYVALAAVLIFSAPFFMQVFALQYRAWQVEFNRFYEAKAPIGDFVRWALSGAKHP